jgi:tetratricopeptide (TPR) repeat protein
VIDVGQELLGGRFEVVRQIGEGGMGMVFEAIDRRGGARVALKTLHHLSGRKLYQFKQEFRALEHIQHPNLIHLRELHSEGELWFFTMDLVEGADFRRYVRGSRDSIDLLDTGQLLTTLDSDAAGFDTDSPINVESRWHGPADGSLDEARLRDVLAQLVRGLDALHGAGRVHRDIKPSNVLVTAEGRVVVLDFGLIAELDGLRFRPAEQGGFSGTVPYMSPEQALEKELGPASDLYAVGVMLYEVLCGELPFTGHLLQVIQAKHRGIFEPAVAVSSQTPELSRLCDRLLSPQPEARPSADEILGILLGADAPATSAAGPPRRSALFVGRDSELGVLERAWQGVCEGTAANVMVVGEAGVGKSALVRRFVDLREASNDDLLLLYGRCYEREMVPYKGVDRVVDDLSRFLQRVDGVDDLLTDDVAALARLFPVLEQVREVRALLESAHRIRNPRELRRRGFAALEGLLARVARQRRLMVVIDDLQWADADSLALLGELMSPPDAPPMLLLMTQRPSRTLDKYGFADHLLELRLENLSDDEVAEFAGSLGVGERSEIDKLVRETQGHPLFVQQLVQHGGRDEVSGEIALEKMLLERVQTVPGTVRGLIELVSLAGVPLEIDVLAHALGVGFADGLEAARHAQLEMLLRLENRAGQSLVEAYHDRIREAVAAHLDPGARPSLHKSLADALEATGQAAERPHLMVRHLDGAGESRRAADFAAQAAQRASQAMAFERAAELYRTALDIAEHAPADARRLRLALADALSNAGHGIEAAELYLDALDDVPPDRRLELRHRAAAEFITNGDVDRGLKLVDEVLQSVGVAPLGSTLATMARIGLNRLRFSLFGLRRRRHEGPDAEPMLRRLEIFSTLARRLAPIDTLRGFDFQNRELRLALRYGDDRQLACALATEASYRSSAATEKSIEAAEELLVRARRLAEGLDDPWLDHYLAVQWGIICFFADRFRVAVEVLEEAIGWFVEESAGDQYIVNSARLFLMFSFRHLGEVRRGTRYFEEITRDARRRNDRLVLTTLGASAPSYFLFADDPERARHELESAAWTPSKDTVHLQHWFHFAARSKVAIYEGRADAFLAAHEAEIRKLTRSPILRGARSTLGSHLWEEGRLVAAAADEGRSQGPSVRRLRRLVRKLRREDSRMVQLWAGMLEACAHAVAGEARECIDTLEIHIEAASAIDMMLCEITMTSRLGELLCHTGVDEARGAELVEASRAWMEDEGIVRPARITQLLMPGFARVLQ